MRKGKKLLVAFLSLCVMAFTGCIPKSVKYTVVVQGEPQQVELGELAVRPITPTKAPTVDKVYTFDGWYVADKNGKMTDKKWDFDKDVVTKDVIIVAKFIESVRQYTVTFKNEDGSVISSSEIAYGTVITAPTAPTKEADAQYTYTFAGWSGYTDGMTVTGELEFIATFDSTLKTSTKEVVIKTEQLDGSFAQDSSSFTYEGYADPTQEQINALIDAPVGYTGTAVYEEGKIVITYVLNEYTVVFYNADGNECGNLEYKHGANLIVPSDPSYDAGSGFAHTFLGWTLVEGGEVVELPTIVTGNAVYYAKFDGNFAINLPENQVGYTLTSDKQEAEQGETVTLTLAVDGAYSQSAESVIVKHNGNPLTLTDGVYTFVASGVNTITVEGLELNTYTVSAEESDIYAVEFSVWDENAKDFVTANLNEIKHGTEVKAVFTVDRKYVKNSAIIKAYANETQIRDFMPLGDGVYLATFTVTEDSEITMNDEDWLCYILTATFKNEDGTVLDTIEFERGEEVPLTAQIPTKDADAQFTYTFERWEGYTDDMTSTEDVTFTPVFSSTVNKYTVAFKNIDGSDISSSSIDYGSAIEEPQAPTYSDGSENVYTFVGWTTVFGGTEAEEVAETVTGAVTYYAVYTSTLRNYAIIGLTGTGYTITINEDSSTWIKDATITFTLALDNGYDFSTPVVKIGDEEIVAVEGVYTFTLQGNTEIVVEDVELNTYTLTTTNGAGYTVAVGGSNVYGETQTITLTVAKNYVDDLSNVVITVGETVYDELEWTDGEDDAKVATISLVNGTALTEIETAVQVTGLKINTASATVSYYVESLGEGYEYHSTIDVTATDNGEGLDIGIADYVGENAQAITGFTYEKYEYEVGQNEAKIYYTRNSYNVTFYNAEGEEIAGYGSMKYGATISTPASPAKADDGETYYTFLGWALEEDGEVVDVLTAVPVDGVAYYPVYEAKVYTYSVNLPAEQVGYTITAQGANTATDAITFTFTLTEEDWNTENLAITIAGQDKTEELLTNGTLALTPADLGLSKGGAIDVTVVGLDYNYYAITLPAEQVGYTLTADKNTAKKGENVTLTLALGVGYENSPVVVKLNGEEITGENGEYTFVAGNVNEITVEGVDLNTYAITVRESDNYAFGFFVEKPDYVPAEGDTLYDQYIELESTTGIVHGTEIVVAFTLKAEYAHIAPQVYAGETLLSGFTCLDEEAAQYAVSYTVNGNCEFYIDDTNWTAQEYAVSVAQSDKYSVVIYALNNESGAYEQLDSNADVKAGTIVRIEYTVNAQYSNADHVILMNSLELEADSNDGCVYVDHIRVYADSVFSMNDSEWALNTYALSAQQSDKYTVEFLSAEGEEIADISAIDYGTQVLVRYTVNSAYSQNGAPTILANGSVVDGFEANGNVYEKTITVNGDLAFSADTSAWALNKYTVIFYNEDGETVIKTETLDYGSAIIAPEVEPTKSATAQYTYTFAGWTGYIDDMIATEDVSFIAEFDATVNKYTVTFKNEDGSVYSSAEVEYDTEIALPETTPTKTADAQYTYTFTGWAGYDYENGMVVTSDVEFVATFSSSIRSYALTVEQSEKYSVELYVYNGESCEVITDTSALTYGTEIRAVFTINNIDTENATIKAYVNGEQIGLLTCSSSKYVANIVVQADSVITIIDEELGFSEFVVTFKNGDEIVKSESLKNGAEIIAPADPIKEADAQYTYTFAGWEGYTAGMTVSGEAVFTATFTSTVNKYDVVIGDNEAVKYEYGAKIEKPEDPTKDADAKFTYTFDGWYNGDVKWNFDTDVVTDNVTLVARFIESVRKYTVSYIVDGIVVDEEEVEYNANATLASVSKESEGAQVYTFKHWSTTESGEAFDGKVLKAETLYAVFEVAYRTSGKLGFASGFADNYSLYNIDDSVVTIADNSVSVGSDGNFEQILSAGTYTLTATHGKFESVSATLTVSDTEYEWGEIKFENHLMTLDRITYENGVLTPKTGSGTTYQTALFSNDITSNIFAIRQKVNPVSGLYMTNSEQIGFRIDGGNNKNVNLLIYDSKLRVMFNNTFDNNSEVSFVDTTAGIKSKTEPYYLSAVVQRSATTFVVSIFVDDTLMLSVDLAGVNVNYATTGVSYSYSDYIPFSETVKVGAMINYSNNKYTSVPLTLSDADYSVDANAIESYFNGKVGIAGRISLPSDLLGEDYVDEYGSAVSVKVNGVNATLNTANGLFTAVVDKNSTVTISASASGAFVASEKTKTVQDVTMATGNIGVIALEGYIGKTGFTLSANNTIDENGHILPKEATYQRALIKPNAKATTFVVKHTVNPNELYVAQQEGKSKPNPQHGVAITDGTNILAMVIENKNMRFISTSNNKSQNVSGASSNPSLTTLTSAYTLTYFITVTKVDSVTTYALDVYLTYTESGSEKTIKLFDKSNCKVDTTNTVPVDLPTGTITGVGACWHFSSGRYTAGVGFTVSDVHISDDAKVISAQQTSLNNLVSGS